MGIIVRQTDHERLAYIGRAIDRHISSDHQIEAGIRRREFAALIADHGRLQRPELLRIRIRSSALRQVLPVLTALTAVDIPLKIGKIAAQSERGKSAGIRYPIQVKLSAVPVVIDRQRYRLRQVDRIDGHRPYRQHCHDHHYQHQQFF